MDWREDWRASVDRVRTYRDRWGTLPTLTGAVKVGATAFHDAVRDLSRNLREAGEYGVPARTALVAFDRDCSVETSRWLGLDERDPDAYVLSTDPIEAANDPFAACVVNEHVFYRLTAHTGALPARYGTIRDGRFRPLETGSGRESVPALLDDVGTLVVKPVDGGRGSGVRIVEAAADGDVVVNGARLGPRAFERRLRALDGLLVEEFVSQHEYAERIFPGATNTLRLLTVVDPETGEPAVVRATHRFGSPASRPVDNWSRGGRCAPIDVDEGTVGDLVLVDGDGRRRSAVHPDTGARVGGVRIPGWETVVDTVETVAAVHDRVQIVGWDVVVTDDGPVVLEGNAKPGVHLPQLTGGLLEEERVAAVLDRGPDRGE